MLITKSSFPARTSEDLIVFQIMLFACKLSHFTAMITQGTRKQIPAKEENFTVINRRMLVWNKRRIKRSFT